MSIKFAYGLLAKPLVFPLFIIYGVFWYRLDQPIVGCILMILSIYSTLCLVEHVELTDTRLFVVFPFRIYPFRKEKIIEISQVERVVIEPKTAAYFPFFITIFVGEKKWHTFGLGYKQRELFLDRMKERNIKIFDHREYK
jgi:hypothetical protein